MKASQLTRVPERPRQGPDAVLAMPGYLAGYVDRIASAAERLQRVTLDSRSALELIEAFAPHPEVCLYVDPPYLGSTGGYVHEMRSESDHCELAEALNRCAAVVVLSGYPSPLYDDLYSSWHRLDMAAGTGQGGTWANRTEVLWSNRPLGTQPGLWEVAS